MTFFNNLVSPLTFVTSNPKKAEYLEKYLEMPVEHVALDLEEIQSLDLKKIVEHKARQAFESVKRPVVVDDTSLEFAALGKLPGTFMRFFLQELSLEHLCRLIDGKTRNATAHAVLGFFDGKRLKLIEGVLEGTVPTTPAGENGYGWDPIFIPNGYTVTRAQMNEEDYQKTYLQLKPFATLKEFLKKAGSL